MKLNFFNCLCYLIFIMFCVSGLSCASVNFAGSGITAVPEDFFGISPDNSPLNKEDYDLLSEFNASWIRTTIRWSSVEPQKDTWTFDHWDNYLEKAEEAGKKVIFILGFDNGWYFEDNREHRNIDDEQLPLFVNYVEKVVSRYRTRVVYEIWNEPNVIYWKGTNKRFFTLAAAAAKKIREVEPEAVILAGSTFRIPSRFIRGLFDSGAMENVDGFSVHPYAFTPKATIRQYNQLMKILIDYEFNKPVWVTEVGYFTGPRPFFSTRHYPEYIVKTLSSLSARAGEIRNAVWYELMNENNPREGKGRLNPLNYMGLIYPNNIFKPGAETFMLAAGYLAGTEYDPNLPLRERVSDNIISFYYKDDAGTSVLVLWKKGAGKKAIVLSVPDAENLSLHNIHNRDISQLPENPVLEVGREPLFITWDGGGTPRIMRK